jgi:CYTH domain-containing protein
MASEIERKFLLDDVPCVAEKREAIRIDQGYLAIDEGTEVRVRRADEETVLTIKGGHGEVREEVEIHLGERQFEALWPLTEGRRLSNTRHLISLEPGLEVELDISKVASEVLWSPRSSSQTKCKATGSSHPIGLAGRSQVTSASPARIWR